MAYPIHLESAATFDTGLASDIFIAHFASDGALVSALPVVSPETIHVDKFLPSAQRQSSGISDQPLKSRNLNFAHRRRRVPPDPVPDDLDERRDDVVVGL